jgi:hypothetical protein
MAAWADHDLPSFQTSGYRYSINAGLIRTPFETAQPRQRRVFATNAHEFSVSVWVTQAQLTVAEWFLKSYGYNWFEANLTDDLGSNTPHLVRCTGDYSVSVKGYDTYEIQMELETYTEVQELSSYATSRLYPIHFMDEMTATPPNWPKSILEMYDREETHRPITAVAVPDDPVAVENEGYDFMTATPPDVPTVA